MKSYLNRWPVLVTICAVVLIYFLALRTGAACVFFGYRWPDTCWLLRLGQIISESGAIPKSDPFSFTLPLWARLGSPMPYVVYQWLSEVVFYAGYRWFNPIGLLVAVGIIMVTAFVAIPLRHCIRANAPPLWSLLTVAAVSMSGNIRTVVRPEIFSFLYLAMCLTSLRTLRERMSQDNAQNGGDAPTAFSRENQQHV